MGKSKDLQIMWKGKVKDFEVILDQSQGVYHAGNIISGQVIVDFIEPMEMRSILLSFHGSSKVHWVRMPYGRHKHVTYFDAEETYLNEAILLYGSSEGEQLHPAGRHTYPFQYQLPGNCPTSYEGRYGYVNYFCKATIHNPKKFDYDAKHALVLLGVLDLNAEPGNLVMPVRDESLSKVSCCCCVSGNVKASFSIDRGAYVPGEEVYFKAEIVNNSNSVVIGSKVTLKQFTEFLGWSSSPNSSGNLKPKGEVTVLLEKTEGKVNAHETSKWENTSLKIPPVPPSRLEGCNVINITYVITVKYGSDIELSSHLIIGTIPFRQPRLTALTWSQMA